MQLKRNPQQVMADSAAATAFTPAHGQTGADAFIASAWATTVTQQRPEVSPASSAWLAAWMWEDASSYRY